MNINCGYTNYQNRNGLRLPSRWFNSNPKGFMNQTRSSVKNGLANCFKWEWHLWWFGLAEAFTTLPKIKTVAKSCTILGCGLPLFRPLFFFGFQHVPPMLQVPPKQLQQQVAKPAPTASREARKAFVDGESREWVKMSKDVQPEWLPSGNQTWQWKIPYEQRF